MSETINEIQYECSSPEIQKAGLNLPENTEIKHSEEECREQK